MNDAPPAVLPTVAHPPGPRLLRRALLWSVLVVLLLVAQTLLVALTINYEEGREQDNTERAATELGWRATTTLEEGLRKTWDFVRDTKH